MKIKKMEVAVMHGLLSILVLIAIASAFLIPFWIRSRKRSTTIARLKKLENKIAAAESNNVEALASHEKRLERFKGEVSDAELADLAGILALARGEHRSSSGSFIGCRGSVNKLIDNNAPTEALDAFAKDYERILNETDVVQKVLQAFDAKILAFTELAVKADQRLVDLTLEIDRTEAGFQAAEARGFKLMALRAIFSSANDTHTSIRDHLLAERRMGDVITACAHTASLLAEINTALDRLYEHIDDMRGNFAAQQKRREALVESLGHRRQDLSLMRIVAREQYLAVNGFAAQAGAILEEAIDLIVSGGSALANLEMDEANRLLRQITECLDEAEEKLSAIEKARPQAVLSDSSPPVQQQI